MWLLPYVGGYVSLVHILCLCPYNCISSLYLAAAAVAAVVAAAAVAAGIVVVCLRIVFAVAMDIVAVVPVPVHLAGLVSSVRNVFPMRMKRKSRSVATVVLAHDNLFTRHDWSTHHD